MNRVVIERHLVRLFWMLATALALLLALWLGLAVYNHADEPLDQDTLAWLGYPLPAADAARNGFIDQIALGSGSQLPRTAAQEWLQAAHSMHDNDVLHALDASPDVFDHLYRHFLVPLDIDLPVIADCKQACYDDLVGRRSTIGPLLISLRPQLARYDAMLAQPEYAEDLIPDLAAVGVGYHPAPQWDTLYESRMVYLLEDGQAEPAYRDWQRRQQFWLGVAGRASTLFNQMLALAALERGEQLLVEMLVRHPETLALARSHALPALDDEGARQMRVQFARELVYELRYTQDGYAQIGMGSWLEHHDEPGPNNIFAGLGGLVGVSLYRPNATLNLARRLHEDAMAAMGLLLDGKALRHFPAELQQCQVWRAGMPLTAANPFGKYLACRASGTFLPVGQHLAAYASATSLVRAALLGDDSNFRQLASTLPHYWDAR